MLGLLLTIGILRGADMITTVQGFNRGRGDLSGFDAPSAVIAQSAAATVEIVGLHWLHEHGHPRMARVIGWIAIGLEAATVSRNIYLNQRHP